MNGILQELQADILDFQAFLTLAEMDEAARQLAAEHLDCVSLFELGKTTEGQLILGEKIGEGIKKALLFKCPHPNAPISTIGHLRKTAHCAQCLIILSTLSVGSRWPGDSGGWLKNGIQFSIT